MNPHFMIFFWSVTCTLVFQHFEVHEKNASQPARRLQQCQNKRQKHQTNHHHAASDSSAGRFETSTFLVLTAVAFLIPKRWTPKTPLGKRERLAWTKRRYTKTPVWPVGYVETLHYAFPFNQIRVGWWLTLSCCSRWSISISAECSRSVNASTWSLQRSKVASNKCTHIQHRKSNVARPPPCEYFQKYINITTSLYLQMLLVWVILDFNQSNKTAERSSS